MFQTATRESSTLRIPVDRLLAVGTVASFFGLLVSDGIPPLAVLLLELFLAF